MPYITSIERVGIEMGRREMLVEVIGMDAEAKFPADAGEIMNLVHAIDNVAALRAAFKAIRSAQSAAEFRAFLDSTAGK